MSLVPASESALGIWQDGSGRIELPKEVENLIVHHTMQNYDRALSTAWMLSRRVARDNSFGTYQLDQAAIRSMQPFIMTCRRIHDTVKEQHSAEKTIMKEITPIEFLTKDTNERRKKQVARVTDGTNSKLPSESNVYSFVRFKGPPRAKMASKYDLASYLEDMQILKDWMSRDDFPDVKIRSAAIVNRSGHSDWHASIRRLMPGPASDEFEAIPVERFEDAIRTWFKFFTACGIETVALNDLGHHINACKFSSPWIEVDNPPTYVVHPKPLDSDYPTRYVVGSHNMVRVSREFGARQENLWPETIEKLERSLVESLSGGSGSHHFLGNLEENLAGRLALDENGHRLLEGSSSTAATADTIIDLSASIGEFRDAQWWEAPRLPTIAASAVPTFSLRGLPSAPHTVDGTDMDRYTESEATASQSADPIRQSMKAKEAQWSNLRSGTGGRLSVRLLDEEPNTIPTNYPF